MARGRARTYTSSIRTHPPSSQRRDASVIPVSGVLFTFHQLSISSHGYSLGSSLVLKVNLRAGESFAEPGQIFDGWTFWEVFEE